MAVTIYWYAGVEPTPTQLPKVLGIVDPSDFRVGENVEPMLPEATSSRLALSPVVAGNWVRIDAGTVNVLWPTVVIQMNIVSVVTALVPVPDVAEEDPLISTRSDAFPPVQLRVRPALRVTEEGNPPVTVSGEASASEVLNVPTSAPPAPFNE